jgi:cytochrome c553
MPVGRAARRCWAWGIAGALAVLAHQPVSAATLDRLPTGAGQCMSCHGEFGISRDNATPHIGGQPAVYLKQALRAYRDGLRTGDAAERMAPYARSLKEDDVDTLAEFFASLKPPK